MRMSNLFMVVESFIGLSESKLRLQDDPGWLMVLNARLNKVNDRTSRVANPLILLSLNTQDLE